MLCYYLKQHIALQFVKILDFKPISTHKLFYNFTSFSCKGLIVCHIVILLEIAGYLLCFAICLYCDVLVIMVAIK